MDRTYKGVSKNKQFLGAFILFLGSLGFLLVGTSSYLGLENQLRDSFIGTSNYLLRVMKYRAAEMDETNLGLNPHSDMTTITVVLQLSNLNGLEIKMNNGAWTAIAAEPSMFAVMAGDAFHVSI